MSCDAAVAASRPVLRPFGGFRAFALVALAIGAFAPSPAAAQDNTFSMIPQQQSGKFGENWPFRLGGFSPAPAAPQQPAEEAEEAAPLQLTPAKSAAGREDGKPRLVKVPLPPIADRALRAAAAAKDAGKDKTRNAVVTTSKAGVAAAPAADPAPAVTAFAPTPAPKATGIFALFSGGGAANIEDGASSGDIVRPAPSISGPATTIAKLEAPGPLSRKKKSSATTKDDDLEDEESESLVEKQAPHVQIACLKPELLALIHKAGEHFGDTPVITSGQRSRGRRGSYHRKCSAADFFIPGVSGSQLVAFLRKLPGAGGVGTYCHTKSIHIDIGEPRDWRQCLYSRSFALRKPVLAAAVQ